MDTPAEFMPVTVRLNDADESVAGIETEQVKPSADGASTALGSSTLHCGIAPPAARRYWEQLLLGKLLSVLPVPAFDVVPFLYDEFERSRNLWLRDGDDA